jgi:hypothetical protein
MLVHSGLAVTKLCDCPKTVVAGLVRKMNNVLEAGWLVYLEGVRRTGNVLSLTSQQPSQIEEQVGP